MSIENYKERLEYWVVNNELRTDWLNEHLIVSDIEADHRRELFFDAFNRSNQKIYDDTTRSYLNENYKLFIVDNIIDVSTPLRLFNIFKDHIDTTIIFDCNIRSLSQKHLDVIMGAICSSPDSGLKWPVRLDGYKEFIFNGVCIILDNKPIEELTKREKYKYLNRDCKVI